MKIVHMDYVTKFSVLTDGGHVTSGEVVLRKPQQDATLTHTGIPNDD